MLWYIIGTIPRRNKRGRQAGTETPQATEGTREAFKGESSNPQAEVYMEEQIFTRIA